MNAEIHNNALELMKRDFLPKDWSKIGCQDPNRWVELANQMKENSLIMHALPRNEELPSSIDTNHRAVYFEQMKYGLYVRMALLEDLTN